MHLILGFVSKDNGNFWANILKKILFLGGEVEQTELFQPSFPGLSMLSMLHMQNILPLFLKRGKLP
jgi:hypothetical protein